jgi:hypothetical protein
MKRTILALTLLLLTASFAAAALLVTDSGVSVGNDNTIGERRSSWDTAQATEYIVGWMKIPLNGDLSEGKIRYKYKVNMIAPDKTVFSEGPFQFDNEGYAKIFKPVTSIATAKTTFSPQACQGEWKFEFLIVDLMNGNKEDLGALLPFYLTGSDTSQGAKTIEEGTQRAVDESADMATLALFNTAKQFGAQQEQQRQAAAVSTSTTTSTSLGTSSTTTTTIKKKPVKKKKGR